MTEEKSTTTTKRTNIKSTTRGNKSFGEVNKKVDKLTKDISDLREDFVTLSNGFTEMRIHTIEHNGKLEKILAGVQATLEMSVKEHARFNSDVRQNTQDIVNIKQDVTNVQADVNLVKRDVTDLTKTVKDQGKRIGGLESTSYWIYAGVAVILILGFIISHYASGRDIIDTFRTNSKHKTETVTHTDNTK